MCDACDGQQYIRYDVPVGHPSFGKLMPCQKCNKAEVDRMSGLNPSERRIRLEDIREGGRPDTVKMVRAAREFIANPIGFLTIHGGYGNGKTTALMGIVNALIEKGIEARYITASQLLAYLRETFNKESGQSDYDRLHELAAVPVLCIDEMDKLRGTEYSRELQQELMNRRYRDALKLGTVLAWNGGADAINMPAITSRASEFVVVKNNDPDLRPLIGKVEK